MHLFPADGSDRDVLLDTIDDVGPCRRARIRLGRMAEHHFSRAGLLGNPLLLRSVLAERTRNVTVGSAVLVLPWDDRVRLAEEAQSSTSLPRSTRSMERFASEVTPQLRDKELISSR